MSNPVHFRDARCPYCNRLNDAHTSTESGYLEAPTTGDVSICFGCANILVYTETGQRKPTDEELVEFLLDPDIIKARLACIESAEAVEATTKVADPDWTASDLIEEYP